MEFVSEIPPAQVDALEQRVHARSDVEFAVTLESPHNFYVAPSYPLSVFGGLATNLSEGGVFVAGLALGACAPALGTRLRLRFTIPGVQRAISAVAEVRWVRTASSPGLPAGVGLSFGEISDVDRFLIEGFVRARTPLFHKG